MRIAGHDHGSLDLIPYVLGSDVLREPREMRGGLPDTRFLDVLQDENAPFFRRLTQANALAFPDMAMPAWVLLDCATLPSAMIGFALRREDLPVDLRTRFGAHMGEGRDPDDLFPVSAFCAVHTSRPGRVAAFTLFSLLPGLELGLRTKAMGLLLLGARSQVGVTRRTGRVRALHERIGRLQVLKDRPQVHPRAEDTMVYELEVPAAPVLLDLVLRGSRGPEGPVESSP